MGQLRRPWVVALEARQRAGREHAGDPHPRRSRVVERVVERQQPAEGAAAAASAVIQAKNARGRGASSNSEA